MAEKRKKPVRGAYNVGDKVLNGRYEIIKIIQTKGMSNVYMVQDSQLHKQWCMKEIRRNDDGSSNAEYVAILKESNILKSLNHSYIPRIVTIEDWQDSKLIIMDYVDGISIRDWMTNKSSNGRVPQKLVVSWMTQVCRVMIYLHNREHPIFYRDMKPNNIMIQSDASIKLIDFGISVVVREKGFSYGKAMGTDGYAAPEQSKNGGICDLRSDIYGIGMTMFNMLTGINPASIPKKERFAGNVPSVRSLDSSISVGIEKIVNKCIQPNPDDRYQRCEELLYDLQYYNTLDTAYRNKLRRKVTMTAGMFLSGIFLMIISIIPFGMYNAEQLRTYNNLYLVAQQSGRVEDYEAVLDKDATKIDPYFGLIDTIKIDGEFSLEEEAILLNYVNPNLDYLKSNKRYGELAYDIGKLYWFFYPDTDNGMITSIKWFKDAVDDDYESDLAEVYYQLASFKKNITVSITESNDGGMYKEYWNNLIKAKEQDNGELVNLQLNLSIANCISTYSYNLMKDGISQEDVTKEINDLKKYVEQYTPSIDKATASYNLLKDTVGGLQEKVDRIYGEGE